MLLDETMEWMQAGGKTTCKIDMKQGVKQMVKHLVKCVGGKIKTSLDLRVISSVH
jgi:hypothetical protein